MGNHSNTSITTYYNLSQLHSSHSPKTPIRRITNNETAHSQLPHLRTQSLQTQPGLLPPPTQRMHPRNPRDRLQPALPAQHPPTHRLARSYTLHFRARTLRVEGYGA